MNRAVSWNGTSGKGELLNGSQVSITDPSPFNSIITEHETRKQAILNPPVPPLLFSVTQPDRVTTTDATPTPILAVDIPQTFFGQCELIVFAVSSTGQMKVWKTNGGVRRLSGAPSVSGGLAAANIPGSPWFAGSDPGWSIAPSISGNNVVITATPTGGGTIVWFSRFELTRFNP